jgi:hypothetical protein
MAGSSFTCYNDNQKVQDGVMRLVEYQWQKDTGTGSFTSGREV